MPTEKPVLFSGEMVRAILDGRKTQTRRVIKPQFAKTWGYGVRNQDPEYFSVHVDIKEPNGEWRWLRCPYGKRGDRLWVRETWRKGITIDGLAVEYRADLSRRFLDDYPDKSTDWYHLDDMPWRPSIFLPRWASRITLEIVNVKVERVNEISEKDAIAEGACCAYDSDGQMCAFNNLWDSINAKRGYPFDSGAWVWVISFKRVTPT